MLRNIFRKIKEQTPSLFISQKYSDKLHGIRGEIFWTAKCSKTGKTTTGHIQNIVSLDASILIARLLKGTSTPNVSGPAFGIYALAVGTGDLSWNIQNPPPSTNTQRSLFNEIGRKAISVSSFIDPDGSISGVPTNILDLTTTFAEGEAVGPITEMGLLGGDISTNMSIRNPILPPNGAYDGTVDLTGMDTLCNYKSFPVINIGPTMSVNWTWRLSI